MKGKSILIGILYAFSAVEFSHASSFYPYTYCSKESCYMVRGPQSFFFGPLPETVFRVCQDSNMYAMTFDDGPTSAWDGLLDTLAKEGIKATFFVNGNHLGGAEQEERVRRAYREGHQISNHTTHHSDLMRMNEAMILSELDSTRDRIVEVLGKDRRAKVEASVVRPPFGYIDQKVADIFANHGYSAVRWNSDRYDWEMNQDQAPLFMKRFMQHMEFLKKQSEGGLNRSIIDVNHDRAQPTRDSIPAMAKSLRERGYRFVTVSECIGLE